MLFNDYCLELFAATGLVWLAKEYDASCMVIKRSINKDWQTMSLAVAILQVVVTGMKYDEEVIILMGY